MDYAKVSFGTINYVLLGKLTKKYKLKFIKDCIGKCMEQNLKELSATEKTLYLGEICYQYFKAEDVVTKRKKIDLGKFE